MDILLELLEAYIQEVIPSVHQLVVQKSGGEITGPVAGRPATEDMQIGVDRICEELFHKHIAQSGLRVRVYSEHGTYGAETPEFLCAIDPFDGSGLFRRGFERDWWSVLTFFALDGTPLAGGAVDILGKQAYLAHRRRVTLISLEDQTRSDVSPIRRTTLGNDVKLAAYLMSSQYLDTWVQKTAKLRQRFPGIFVWPNGGSCIYPWIAAGKVDAYLMFDEPRSEIDPGLAFVQAAELFAVSVLLNGTLASYQFIPGVQGDRVPFFIAACTPELAKELVREILSN